MRILPIAIALVVSCLLFSSHTAAKVGEPSEALAPDVRVIIDISGSMKQNDPQNLRRPALELLVQLFPEGSKAGVWTFGQWVNMLVSHKPVTDQWKKDALKKAQKINSVALHTNIPEVLLKATDDIKRLDPNYKTSLILLTDGMVDVSKSPEENNKARRRIIDEIIPMLRKAGITVHTVALSQNADQELMERLAVETNGLAAVAESAEELTQIFLQAFDASVPAEQVPLEGNSFLVDSSIEEYTVLIFRKAGTDDAVLVSPDGKRYTHKTRDKYISWFHQSDYDLITVKRPYEGQWSIVADLAPNSRVTIVSNLSLLVSPLAKSTFVGGDVTVSAVLKEKGQNIVNAELLDLVDVVIDVQRKNDQQSWTNSVSKTNPVPDKGVFALELEMMREKGVYEVTVRANSKTFQRQHKQTVEVREPFSVALKSSDANTPNHEVTLFAVNPAINLEKTTVNVNIDLPDGSSDTQTLSTTSARTWVVPIKGIEQSGIYSIRFDIAGQFQDGVRFNYSTRVKTIEHRVAGSEFKVPEEPVPEPEPEKEPEKVVEPPVEPEAEPEVEQEPEAEDGFDLKSIILYSGIFIGNLLVFGLGFYVYKLVTSKSGSDILEQDDELEDVDDAQNSDDEETQVDPEPATAVEPAPEPDEVEDLDTELLDNDDDIDEVDIDVEDSDLDDVDTAEEDADDGLGDILDLPDDAIDIDPGADEKT